MTTSGTCVAVLPRPSNTGQASAAILTPEILKLDIEASTLQNAASCPTVSIRLREDSANMEDYSAYDHSFSNEQTQGYTPYSPQSATSAASAYSIWSFQDPASLQQPQPAKGRSQSVGQAPVSPFFDTPAAMAPMRPATSRGNRDSGLVDKDGIPITYTPTTHRISKAKKGKKVHVCEYGCGKVRSFAATQKFAAKPDRFSQEQSIESEDPKIPYLHRSCETKTT